MDTLSVVDDRLSTTSLCLATSYGAWNDPPGGEGIAHLLEHLLIYSPLYGEGSLSDRISQRGGYCNAETHADGMVFSAQVHPDDADTTLELMLEALFKPSPADAPFDQEREAVLRELAVQDSDPSDLVQRSFAHAVLSEPLSCAVGGTQEAVRSLTREQTFSCHAEHFLTGDFTLVHAGPKTLRGMRESGWDVQPPDSGESGSAVNRNTPIPTPPITWSGSFAWMCVGAQAPAWHSPDRPAFNVLEFMLGSRSTSLLNHRLRINRSLAYAFEAWYRGYNGIGTWSVIAGAESGNGDEIFQEIQKCIADIANGSSDPRYFSIAKKQAVMQVLRDSDSPFEWAAQLARKAKSRYLFSGVDCEIQLLEKVDFADVRRAAEYILENLVIVVETES